MRLSGKIAWRLRDSVPIAAVLLAAIGCDVARPPHPADGRRLGPLPIVSLVEATRQPPELDGRVTLLNFWGTWCPPCRMELPGLVRLAASLAGEPRFQFVAVSCCGGGDDTDLARETAAFLEARQLAVEPWAFADPLAASLFASAFALEAFPTTYLVGPDGRVRRVWTGYRSRDEAEIAAAILAVLKEPRPQADAR
ncbi:MAG: TlpA family protein disulfide reductase [Pirellulales bacterium]